ncbi:MAG: hydrogenase 4 subunit F [Nitrospiraceae bacterium]|nr:hydrogenase 4 subunit F [Nitrospiraceae bacterium]
MAMIIILFMPIITATVCYLLKNHRLVGYANLAGASALAVFAIPTILSFVSNPGTALNGMLYMDALSVYIMVLVILLGLASSAYSIGYLEHEFDMKLMDVKGIRRYYLLLHIFIFTMLLVTVANNLALMWIAIEATTIVSAILIGLGFTKRQLAIEAAWKYIMLCTVGITFALLGIFIIYYASTAVNGTKGELNWTALKEIAGRLNPATMKLAFIFVLVGYGTKAGLAPMHNWLPDAHSQAPSPISALLSGILLNTAFYGIIRVIAIVEPSTGAIFTGNLLIIFGLISIGISAVFILVQENYKRLLAYSSIEHMGIVSLGVGIGGVLGFYGALLHILNHAISKPLMFFASGRIQACYGSTKIENVNGVLSSKPLLGMLTFAGVLSLAGSPPLNIFISEFTILKAGVDKGLWAAVGLFLFFAVIVFYGMMSGFGKILFKGKNNIPPKEEGCEHRKFPMSWLNNGVMIVMALLILMLGVSIPEFLDKTIRACISVIGVR